MERAVTAILALQRAAGTAAVARALSACERLLQRALHIDGGPSFDDADGARKYLREQYAQTHKKKMSADAEQRLNEFAAVAAWPDEAITIKPDARSPTSTARRA